MKPFTRDLLCCLLACLLMIVAGMAIAYAGRYWESAGVQV